MKQFLKFIKVIDDAVQRWVDAGAFFLMRCGYSKYRIMAWTVLGISSAASMRGFHKLQSNIISLLSFSLVSSFMLLMLFAWSWIIARNSTATTLTILDRPNPMLRTLAWIASIHTFFDSFDALSVVLAVIYGFLNIVFAYLFSTPKEPPAKKEERVLLKNLRPAESS